MNKILDFESAVSRAKELKKQGLKVVLCHGVFDLLHIGHLRYLRRAREFGDVLMVTVTPDQYVNKGPGRPVFTGHLRAEALASLDCVDYVALNLWPTAVETITALRPDFYVKGAEYKNIHDDLTGNMAREAAAAEAAGSALAFVEDIVFSSSSLINQHLSIYPRELAQYLNLLRQRYDLEEVLRMIDSLSGLKVLVVGDAIIDQYAYCTPLGLSSKDPTMALRQINQEVFPGGAMAVAGHAAGLSGEVTLFSIFGEDCPYEDLVRRTLPANVRLIAHRAPGPTVRKLRYVDSYSMAKMLEIYHLSEEAVPADIEQAMCRQLSEIIGDYDVVLAPDYGHGLITGGMIEILCRAPFLAVNTQANAANRGYHTIWRYPRADFISLARHELALAFQDRKAPVQDLMKILWDRLRPRTLVATCGSDGLEAMNTDEYIQTPALAIRTVDRVGAGDALFVAMALAAYRGCPLEMMGLIGNLAGARLVEAVGNNVSINAAFIKKALIAMLK